MRVAINGFGRIGRSFLRACFSDKTFLQQIEIVAINVGPSNIEHVAHMFKYDTFMGMFHGTVSLEKNILCINGYKIKLIAQMTIEQLPWADLEIDWVVESTGAFTRREQAEKHILAGSKKVVISAPGKSVDATIVMGVNEESYHPGTHNIISLASCTTNALAPIVKVIHEAFGVKVAFMNTVHSFTNSQVLLDVESDDLRTARSAVLNIIPTTTGAAKLIDVVYPKLKGCISGLSVRVPVGKVSLLDVVFVTESESLSVEQVHAALNQARTSYLKGILDCETLPLVSSDYTNNSHSVVIDTLLTDVCKGSVKIFGWYDNEYGYAHRIKDFLYKYR